VACLLRPEFEFKNNSNNLLQLITWLPRFSNETKFNYFLSTMDYLSSLRETWKGRLNLNFLSIFFALYSTWIHKRHVSIKTLRPISPKHPIPVPTKNYPPKIHQNSHPLSTWLFHAAAVCNRETRPVVCFNPWSIGGNWLYNYTNIPYPWSVVFTHKWSSN
jgi:hypothetical protein